MRPLYRVHLPAFWNDASVFNFDADARDSSVILREALHGFERHKDRAIILGTGALKYANNSELNVFSGNEHDIADLALFKFCCFVTKNDFVAIGREPLPFFNFKKDFS